ncbi:MAG: hypothetical protein MUE38_03110 [Flavihumibacter sp.]|nr:hypothetical protein [Flavihumibacter sp.]
MECVPEQPVHPKPICQSDGCPAVSPAIMKILNTIIKKQKKSFLFTYVQLIPLRLKQIPIFYR